MVQALEQIKSGTPAEAENGLQLLKHANEVCASLGDAWYYRSLFEKKLAQAPKANYSLSKAKLFGSEAMEQGLDPFTVASSGPPPPSSLAPGAVHEKWALVIGISKFADKQVPKLNYPAKDARDFANLLENPNVGRFKPDNVQLLLDADATTRNIKAALNKLARVAGPDDLVVIFLASHGSGREMDTAKVNYIVTNDTVVRPPDQLYATALAMVELTDAVRSRIAARRTLVILDTCHSGAAASHAGTNEAAIAPEQLDQIRQGYGRAILTSSQVGENSYEDDEAQNGYFTFFLMQALKQTKGLAPIGSVYATVKTQVTKNVQAKFKLPQTPLLSQSDHGGDLIVGIQTAP
jgi:hypothetical protein